jgi:CheY-like chemotaxis protein
MAASAVAQGTICYLDDSAAELEYGAEVLRSAGYRVITSTDVEGLAAELGDADIVLVDYYLPGTDGRTVLARLRTLVAERPRQPLFYLYTNDVSVGANYRELGFDGRVIMKGNGPALLRQVDAVTRIVQLRRMRPT